MTILFPFLVCLIGLVGYLITAAPKPAEVCRIMFWTGLLVTLANYNHVVELFTK